MDGISQIHLIIIYMEERPALSLFGSEYSNGIAIGISETNEPLDFDLMAFCLGSQDTILEDSDFVFYNSNLRGSIEDRTIVSMGLCKFQSISEWRRMTSPVSSDLSVWLESDMPYGEEPYEEGVTLEYMLIYPALIRKDIKKIAFCVTIPEHDQFASLSRCDKIQLKLRIICHKSQETLFQENFCMNGKAAKAILELTRVEPNKFEFKRISSFFDGGIEEMLDAMA